MYKKSYFFALLISLLLSLSLINRNVDAQIDLNKLTDKKSESKQQKITKEDYFNYIKDQILVDTSVDINLAMPLGKKWINPIPIILKDKYQVELSDECRTEGDSYRNMVIKRIINVMERLGKYYQYKIHYPHAVESSEKALASKLGALQKFIDRYKKRCGRADDLPKIMKFIDDYNHLLASVFEKGESLKKQEVEKKEQKASEAKLQAERAVKAKIDQIIKYANTNLTKLEKESKIFRKDVSGVWYAKRDYFTIDLFSPNKIIMIGNARPLPVQTGRYDKDNNYIIVYVTKDGKISRGRDEKPFGFVIRKVKAGGREFKLGISTTDGIEVGSENILGFVRDLK